MPTITTTDGTEIFYKDWGPKDAQPIVFHHGWPLSADDWDNQMMVFLGHGFRVIAHDRRGHGRSSQPWDGNDMDHYADDLAAVIGAVPRLAVKRFTSELDGFAALGLVESGHAAVPGSIAEVLLILGAG